jgi:acetolactate synthase regulatory subunit
MTTFLGAMPRHSDSHTDSPLAQFRVQAAAEPSVLPRILDVFAKVTIVPDSFASERLGPNGGDDDMEIDIRVAGLDARQADQLASRMRAIVDVDQVLVSVESATQTSARRQA